MAVIKKSKIAGLNFEEMLENMQPSQFLKNIEKDWLRMQEVLELKEKHPGLLGKRYLIKNNLVTPEEYEKYKGKSQEKMEWEKNVEISRVASDPNPVRDMSSY